MHLTVKQEISNGAIIEYLYIESTSVKYNSYLNIIFLLAAVQSFSQERLNPERPGESRTPELVKGNNLQAEIGFRKERIEKDQFLYQHPELLLRYGLFNALELRMELTSQTIKDNVSKNSLNGIAPVYFGVKAKILPQYKWLPSIGALAEVGFPSLASGDYFVTGIPFRFRTMFNHNINEKFSLQYNVGVQWNETNNQKDNKQWLYTLTPSLKVSDQLQLFIEEYAFLRSGTGAEHYFDGGAKYFVNNNFVVDLSAGAGLSKTSSDFMIEGGFSYRFNFSK